MVHPLRPPNPRTPPALAFPVAVLGVAAVFWLLRQDAMHGLDAYRLVPRIEAGETDHPRHVLYLELAARTYRWIGGPGFGGFDVMRLLAAFAAATGVVATWWAWRGLGLTRTRASLAAIMAALLPGVLHFATTAELNAMTFGSGALAFAMLSRAAAGPSDHALWIRMVPIGVVTAIGAGLHSIGNLTPAMLALFVPAMGGTGGRRPAILTLLATHTACYLAIVAWAGSVAESVADHTDFVSSLAVQAGNLPHVLWYEWLYPFAPASVLWLLAWFGDATGRHLATAAGLSVLGYLAVDTVILGPLVDTGPFLPGGKLTEYGAYALAVIAPLSGLAVRSLPGATAWLATGATLILGGSHWLDQQAQVCNPALRAAIAAAAESPDCTLVVGDYREKDAALAARTDATLLSVPEIAFEVLARGVENPEHLSLWFDLQFRDAEKAGRQMLISPRALEQFADHDAELLRHLAGHLRERYSFTKQPDGQLLAIRPRP